MDTDDAPIEAWSRRLGKARVERLVHGNPEVSLWSVTGVDQRSYVLRAAGRWRPGAGLADEHRVLFHLRKSGVSVAAPVRTDRGTLAVGQGDRTYVLSARLATERVAPELLPDADAVCTRIGSAIGELHLALAQYPVRVNSYEHDLWQHAFEESCPKLPPDIREQFVDPHASTARAVLRGLPMQLIHGDCNSSNVLLSNGYVSGFIDFDHLPVGQRVYDLAYYLVHRLRELISSGDRGRRSTAFLSAVGRYAAGYHAANPLSEAERQALAAVMLAAEVSLTSWSHVLLTELRHRAGPTEADKYAQGVGGLRWISHHFDDLTEAVARA